MLSINLENPTYLKGKVEKMLNKAMFFQSFCETSTYAFIKSANKYL